MNKSKILVTGGYGFIGSHLVTLLIKKGYDVTSLEITKENSNRLKTIQLDLANYDPKKEPISKGFDVIFHLASSTDFNAMLNNPKGCIANNINSTLNLLEDIRLNNPSCLFVFASTEKIYGNQREGSFDEETPAMPVDPYGISKLACEQLVKSFHLTYGINYVITRAGNVFGPNQNANLFIPSILRQIIEGKTELTLGNLAPYRNFVFIEDVVQAYYLFLIKEKAINKTFNLSSYNVRISDVLNKILAICYKRLGKKPKIMQDKTLFRSSEKKTKRYTLNSAFAKKVLEWKTTHTFQEAIEKTFDSYLKQK